MKRILILFILLLCLQSAISAPIDADTDSKQDTVCVHELFSKGYEFIDGPSDSLLYYFNEALVIIDERLSQLQNTPDQKWMDVFKRLKWRVFIEFGIEHFFKSDYLQALEYFHLSLVLAKEINDPELLSESYSEIGIVLKNQGNFDDAIDFYENAVDFARLGTDTSWMASCLVNLGNAYKEKGFLIISQEYYLEALKTLEPLRESRRLAACYQNIGEVYSLQKDFKKARAYYDRALQLATRSGDKMREASCNMNLGFVLAEFGDYEHARAYYEKALEYFEESGYSHEMDDCYILFGDSWLSEGRAGKAMEYYMTAEEISTREEDYRKLAEIYCKMGKASLLQGTLNQAEQYCRQSLELAKATSYLEIERQVHMVLSDIFMKKGELATALKHYKEQSILKDSIFNAHKYSALAELEVKYETEKKEQQIALYSEQAEVQRLTLQQRNRLMFVIIAGAVLMLFIAYLLFQRNRARAEKKASDLEQKLLRSQMNPHFIFNSLIAIQSYIYRKDAVKAGDYLASFAELVRFTLEASRTELISLEKEIKMMKVYLDLQKLRFENHFDYILESDKTLDSEEFCIPPMFAQPFIENAIEHGLRHRKAGGTVKINYEKLNKTTLKITVSDNGIGREASGELGEKSGRRSMGITITGERLEVLSKRYHQKFSMKSIDLTNKNGQNAGFEVQIEIPLRNNLNQ